MLGNKQIMGENIQLYMDIFEISRKDFAKAIGEPYSSVTDWINGKTYPRIDKIQKMADFFGIEKACLVEKQEIRQHREMKKAEFENDLIEAYRKASLKDKNAVRFILGLPLIEETTEVGVS